MARVGSSTSIDGARTTIHTVDSSVKRPPVVEPPEDGDNERPRGEEIRRHASTVQQHENDPNYHPPKDLRGLYAGYTTAELEKTYFLRCERLWKIYGLRDFAMRTPSHTEVGDVTGQQLFDELMEVKQELWRRWKTGDLSAKLPDFAH